MSATKTKSLTGKQIDRMLSGPEMDFFVVAAFPSLAAAHAANSDTFRRAYRNAARRLHPDANNGVQPGEWATLQQAASVLNRHHGL